MDKQRIYFNGFIVGFAMLIIPIPDFFFWSGIIEHIHNFFTYTGFIFFVVCGIPLLFNVIFVLVKEFDRMLNP